MKLASLVPALLVLAVTFGCSKSAPPPGKPVAIAAACNEPDKSRLRLTGYLRYRRGLMSFCSNYGGRKTCDLALYESAERPAPFNIMKPRTGPEPISARLSVPVGSSPGEMEDLPEKFSDADVKLHLPQDAVAAEGAHVVIDGVVSVIPGDPKAPAAPKSCYVTVEWAAPG
jgi:hypothetical protein